MRLFVSTKAVGVCVVWMLLSSMFSQASSYSDYIIGLLELNKSYRLKLAEEISDENNSIVITSLDPTPVQNRRKDFKYEEYYINKKQSFYRVLRELRLDEMKRDFITGQLKNDLASGTVDVDLEMIPLYRVSVYNKKGDRLHSVFIEASGMIFIQYPLTGQEDRLNSGLFAYVISQLPLDDVQLQFMAGKLTASRLRMIDELNAKSREKVRE